MGVTVPNLTKALAGERTTCGLLPDCRAATAVPTVGEAADEMPSTAGGTSAGACLSPLRVATLGAAGLPERR